jgi:hypothetical protein
VTKIPELFDAHVADGAQIETLLGPGSTLNPCMVFGFRAVLSIRNSPDEQINDAVASPIRARRDSTELNAKPLDRIQATP